MNKLKRLSVAAGLCLMTGAALAAGPVATPAGQAMFTKLTQLSGILSVDPRVKVVVAKVQGSYTNSSGTIYIAPSDISLCKRDISCVAAIVAHELGHNVLGHTRGHRYASKQQEKDADIYGVKLTAKAGFDPCAGAAFFKTIGAMFGDDGGGDHPNNSVRVAYIMQECKGNIAEPNKPWVSNHNYNYSGSTTSHKVGN